MSLACELPAQRRLVQYRRRLCGFGGGAVDSEYGSRRCHRALEPQQTYGRIYERSLLTSLPRPLPSVPPMRGKLPVGTKFIIQEYRSRCSLARGIDCGLLQVFDLIYEYARPLTRRRVETIIPV